MTLNDDTLQTRLILFIQSLVPVALVLALLLLNIIDTPLTPDTPLRIPFFMMAVYYWALFHPRFLPGWAVFGGGLLIDFILMMPIGLNALLYTALQKLVITQRPYIITQPFPIIWMIFGLLYSAAVLLTSLFYPGMFARMLSDPYLIGGLVINTLLFPLVYAALHLSHKIMQKPPPSPLERRKKKKIIIKKTKFRKGGLSS